MSGGEPGRVAIVGGGASGTLVAAQLLRQAAGPLEVVLVEPGPEPGCGVAYGTDWAGHLLNVPAHNMSALPDDPEHFVRWLVADAASSGAPGADAGPGTYAPRPAYARYLGAVLNEAVRGARPGVRFAPRRARVTSIRREGNRAVLRLDRGGELDARSVVLALGHSAPSDRVLPALPEEVEPRVVRDPWRPDALRAISRDEPVLLLGSALTMVDVVLQLADWGHVGPLLAVSRHGRLPRSHARDRLAPAPAGLAAELLDAASLRERVLCARRAGNEVDPRAVVDALRPVTAALWQRLSVAERGRFLRHLRPLWDALRHRVAPEVGDALARLLASGQLTVRAARLVAIESRGAGLLVQLRPRGSGRAEPVAVARIVNCTGPETDPARSADPLVRDLLAFGLARRDPLGLGIETAADGGLVARDGRPAGWVFAVGPLRRAELWESVAIPELRVQAQSLAARLLADRIVTGS